VRLFRLVSVIYEPSLDERWSHFGLSEHDGVTVKAYPYRSANDTILRQHTVEATIQVERPQPDQDGFLSVPEIPRLQCEAAIEALVNTVAVFNSVRRSIPEYYTLCGTRR
jgi:hypothetical protein